MCQVDVVFEPVSGWWESWWGCLLLGTSRDFTRAFEIGAGVAYAERVQLVVNCPGGREYRTKFEHPKDSGA